MSTSKIRKDIEIIKRKGEKNGFKQKDCNNCGSIIY